MGIYFFQGWRPVEMREIRFFHFFLYNFGRTTDSYALYAYTLVSGNHFWKDLLMGKFILKHIKAAVISCILWSCKLLCFEIIIIGTFIIK